MQGIREPGDSYIQEADGYLVLEAGLPPSSAMLESAYRAFAVACVQKRIAAALVKLGDSDAIGERALRDALTTMLLAGVDVGFRLALVAATGAIRSRYANAQRDLALVGINVRFFDNEQEATWWLAFPASNGASEAKPSPPSG